MRLSKSRLMSMFQCDKRLWLEVHKKELQEITPAMQSAFDVGNVIGDVAIRHYGDGQGHYIEYKPDLGEAVEETRELMRAGDGAPIFEATFEHEGVLVRVDALLGDGDGYHLIEVKSGASVKDQYVADCAIQAWVFCGNDYDLQRVSLTHVNYDFVYQGDGQYRGLLTENDVSEQVAATVSSVAGWVDQAQDILSQSEPDIAIGTHCGKPYQCSFFGYCSKTNGKYPVAGLRGSRAKLGQFIAEGYQDLCEVPEDRLARGQKRIQEVTRTGEPELKPGAREFAEGLAYPRYYLDFETIGFTVPIWAGCTPRDQAPFQFSCHVESAPGQIMHVEFLDLSGKNPERACAEALIASLGTDGPILQYTTYEASVLRSLGKQFPDLREPLNALIERLVDLHPVTKENYYHPDMLGSWSIKAVIPTVAPDLDYKALDEVSEGLGAQKAYVEAIDPKTTLERKEQLRKRLLEYCKYDSLSMVRLVEYFATAATC